VAKGSAADRSCSLSSGFTPSSLYLLGQGGEQVTELSVAGGLATPAHSNVFWGGKLLATYDLPNGGFHIPLTDPLGTKRVQVSGTGMAELNCLSLPYGNDLGNPRVVNCYTPTYGTPAPDATEHHFTGKERDTESGNDYFEARYYGSSMGRFLSPDDGEDQSSSNPQSWNLYSYGRNNPLIGTDDDGNTYNVCDSNGKNCSNIDDKTFEAEQKKDQANGESFANGTLSHTDANGNTVKDGSFTHDPDIAGDPASNIAAMGNIGNRGMSGIKAFAVGSVAIGGCVALCPAAGTAALAAGRGLYYAAMGLLPAVPGALEKLQKLDLSVGEANEIIESPTTQRLVDNANNGNINYIADMGGKLIRITTDPTGQRIISAGRVQANGIANGIANGRFTK
jgi:RHS repeat-associated protein